MNTEEKYNGWTNYETWCVHLWLTNDEGSYRHWREVAREHSDEAAAPTHGDSFTAEERARITLAQALEESFETSHPFRGEHLDTSRACDVFGDLLDAALSEVNWHEVAEAFLEDL